jgi:FtsZ-binding cell division protein ZapB
VGGGVVITPITQPAEAGAHELAAMASEIRALKANNAELGTSLQAALKRIDELQSENADLKVSGGSALALIGQIRERVLNERQRIINMLTRFAEIDEDGGDLAEAEVQRGIIRAIEELRHLGPDGESIEEAS